MDQVSNRALAILLVVAIVISIGGTLISLNRIGQMRGLEPTGLAVLTDENATVSLTVQSITAVNFTTYTVAWGTGAVDSAGQSCNLTSQGYNGSSSGAYGLAGNDCDDDPFDIVTGGLVLENIGNNNVTLNISCGKTAATFIGGSVEGPLYRWNVTDEYTGIENNSCMGSHNLLAALVSGWQDCTAFTGTGTRVCNQTRGGFNFEPYADTLRFDVMVQIPQDAPQGSKSDTITAIIEATSPE